MVDEEAYQTAKRFIAKYGVTAQAEAFSYAEQKGKAGDYVGEEQWMAVFDAILDLKTRLSVRPKTNVIFSTSYVPSDALLTIRRIDPPCLCVSVV